MITMSQDKPAAKTPAVKEETKAAEPAKQPKKALHSWRPRSIAWAAFIAHAEGVPLRYLYLPFLPVGMRAIEHGDIPDHPDQLAVGPLSDLLREGELLLLELHELELDELMGVERLPDGREQLLGDAVLADLDDRLELVRQTPQIFSLRSFQLFH